MLEIEDKIRVKRIVCRHGIDCELKAVTEIRDNHYKITVSQAVCPQCMANYRMQFRPLGQ